MEHARYVADAVVEIAGPGGDAVAAVTVHRPGAIDVVGGRITGIGAPSELPPAGPDVAVHTIGGLLLPGLVNAHSHGPMVIFRSAGDGLPLDRWLTEAIWPREGRMNGDDVFAGMLLGSAEMLLAGVTTSVEMYLHDEAIFRAVAQTGARLVSTPGVVMALHGDDIDGRLAEIGELHARFHRPDERVSVGFGPHSVYDLSADTLAEVAAAARDLDTVLHIHLEETRAERDLVIEREGRTATRFMADLGILDQRVLGAHGIWLDDTDRRLLADAGASIAHCPSSNLKLGSGFADVRALLDAGVNVTVATDGAASADSLDLWHGVRLAPGLARALRLDAQALSVEQTLLMATTNGGRAIGQPDVGTLTVGSRADFCRIDLDQPMLSPALDDHELLTHVVFNTVSAFVTDVWVDGRPVVIDREVVGIDLEAATADVARRARRLTA